MGRDTSASGHVCLSVGVVASCLVVNLIICGVLVLVEDLPDRAGFCPC